MYPAKNFEITYTEDPPSLIDNPQTPRRTSKRLSKYERTMILALRTTMIANGSAPLINVDPTRFHAWQIAEDEMRQRKLPFLIHRYLLDGSCEIYHAEDLNNESWHRYG
ncbi:hypothetical protein LAZ67_20000419 [Cordylochernes scorpioides]|uniref:Uncharacterized protein n=1 Tax=Cordylochernes scorpioides TaxID=51811 RepID=A0ABY6LJ68_9ARAC|nr:hypothetical protein LAZ67_20000419 [Cordylochernes scorpioides]